PTLFPYTTLFRSGSAQTNLMRKVSGGIRTDLAQYRELAAFAQFASDLDEATRRQLERGRLVVEVLKQPQYQPLPVWEMGTTLYAVDKGYFDDVPVEQVLAFEKAMKDYIRSKYTELVARLEETNALDEESEEQLKAAIEDSKKNGAY